jgi:hypothetical protein
MALYGLCAVRLSDAFAVRVAKVLGWAIGVIFGLAVLLLWPTMRGASADVVIMRAVVWLSWLAGGLAAWSTAHDLRAHDETDGIVMLVAQRGYHRSALVRAHWAASCGVVAQVAVRPALALIALALATAPSAHELGIRLVFALGLIGYVLGLSAVLGSVARGAAWLWPKHGRTLLVLLVVAFCLTEPGGDGSWTVPALFWRWLGVLEQGGASIV